MQPDLPSAKPKLGHLWVPFITLHLIGQVGIVLILLTNSFAKTVHFHPTIVNFSVTWLIYSVSYSLQLYSSHHKRDPDYVGPLCRVQAVLVDGVPALAATAALITVAQIWFSLQRAPSTSSIFKPTLSETRRHRLILAFLIILPYIVFFAFGLASYLYGTRYQNSTGLNELYCSMDRDEFIPAYCTAIVVVVIIFQVAIMVKYIKTRRKASDAFPLTDKTFPASLAVRVMIFSVVALLVLCIGVSFMSNDLSSYPYMMQASLPLAAVITFGSQQNLLRVWCFWRRQPSSDKPGLHVRQTSTTSSDMTVYSKPITASPRLSVSERPFAENMFGGRDTVRGTF
ncbi:hypothetical protein D9758_002267 [Tetrapyrgos nigripes]|uniref:Uncharacterized protein n=1 Tax=Tetrapyrgos nigripes TaxID=182062 RepID=A0A8H5GPZ3_9AGAR|nr:hypothetical protein D9758_002267 [Tetrapyrgos nigripes]